MAISAFSDEFATDFNEQMDICEKYDIKYIEIRNVNGKNFCDHTLDEVKELKKIMDKRGFKVSAIGSPLGKINITHDFKAHLELFKKVLDMADIVKTKYIRMFSFFMPKGEKPEKYRDEVISRWQEFIKIAKGRNIILLHENEKDIYGDTAERCYDLLSTLNCDYVRATFDPANFVQCDVKPYPDAFNLLKPYIEYVHIKDAKFYDHTVTPAGLGDAMIKEILENLNNNNYNGFLSLEPHLAEFTGFASLENGESINVNTKLKGEEVLKTAYTAFQAVINELLTPITPDNSIIHNKN